MSYLQAAAALTQTVGWPLKRHPTNQRAGIQLGASLLDETPVDHSTPAGRSSGELWLAAKQRCEEISLPGHQTGIRPGDE
ncbi:hypothetical protein ATANTOWER_020112 [Ataeniobius toweri]|uniref:Uncharacterized protein n=1 Tax=Ataeniobius toweri TaxID=208326 RepID=A0ABU7BZT3_9TELE|nr:hypothetical protein [Ataeniobius toweri]